MSDIHNMRDRDQVEKQYATDKNLQARIALHARFSTNSEGWQTWLLKQVHLPSEATILELGCGPGSLWAQVLDHPGLFSPGWTVTLSDLSQGMVDKARATLADRWPEDAPAPAFAVIDAMDIPWPDDSADIIIANHMIYHLPDIPAGIAEMRRVLRPGGILYATTIGRNHMRALGQLAARFDPSLYLHRMQDECGYVIENAEELLGAHFDETAAMVMPDGLAVTEAQPLVDYVLSVEDPERWPAARADNLRRFIQTELDALGVIEIPKATGLTVAR